MSSSSSLSPPADGDPFNDHQHHDDQDDNIKEDHATEHQQQQEEDYSQSTTTKKMAPQQPLSSSLLPPLSPNKITNPQMIMRRRQQHHLQQSRNNTASGSSASFVEEKESSDVSSAFRSPPAVVSSSLRRPSSSSLLSSSTEMVAATANAADGTPIARKISNTTTTTTTTSLVGNNNVSWDQNSFVVTSTGKTTTTTTGDQHQHMHHYRDSSNMSGSAASLASLQELMNKDDQAERGLLHSMEQRRVIMEQSPAYAGGGEEEIWHAAVQGERPPLGGTANLPLHFQNTILTQQQQQQQYNKRHHRGGSRNNTHYVSSFEVSSEDGEGDDEGSHSSSTKLSIIARRIRQQNQQHQQQQQPDRGPSAAVVKPSPSSHLMRSSSTGTSYIMSTPPTKKPTHHRRLTSRAHVLLDSIQKQDSMTSTSNISNLWSTSSSTTTAAGGGGGESQPRHNKDHTSGTTTNSNNNLESLTNATTSTDRFITGALHVEDLFLQKDGTDHDDEHEHDATTTLQPQETSAETSATPTPATGQEEQARSALAVETVTMADEEEEEEDFNEQRHYHKQQSTSSTTSLAGENIPLITARVEGSPSSSSLLVKRKNYQSNDDDVVTSSTSIVRPSSSRSSLSYDTAAASAANISSSTAPSSFSQRTTTIAIAPTPFKKGSPTTNNKTTTTKISLPQRRATAAKNQKSSCWTSCCCCCCCVDDIFYYLKQIWHLLWYQSYELRIAIPCFLGGVIMVHWLQDPHLNFLKFLPGHTTSVAGWLNFVGRQVVLLDLARMGQWCLIDKLVLGTRVAVQILGPLLTLCLIQARGWPFLISTWGFLDLILLEGITVVVNNNNINGGEGSNGSGGGDDSSPGAVENDINVDSDYYVRLLLSMMLAGWATAIKRTAVAMYFGRRTFVEFKPRLERLLKDVVLVTEMAALAEEAEIIAAADEGEEEQEEEPKRQRQQQQEQMFGGVAATANTAARSRKSRPSLMTDRGVNLLGDVSWSNHNRNMSRRNNKKTSSKAPAVSTGRGQVPQTLPSSATSDASDSEEEEEDDNDDDDDESDLTTQNDIKSEADRFKKRHTDSGSLRVRDLLDHWDEPVNKMDKSLNASIGDILRFRRALTFLDDKQPFGEHFGPASNRDQMITSAHDVYQRLLKLSPGRDVVSCEFYTMLSLEDDGTTVNARKQKALRKLFRPSAKNELSLLAFVQSCDSLYKKLRYFRANVGNASVIDHALESIVDGAFSFVLALVLLSVMRINPWPLLVSISTLLVSVSFAVGSSASKWFEGMLLVAARRPFDLGDRIYMTEPSLVISDGLWYCWFVEDINLFHTTIRYAGTNEVATINNGSVANMRIMNGARSPNAAVWFQFPYRPNLMEDGNIDKIKEALENYARENPRDWHSFGYFRVDEVHPDIEKLVVTIGLQHRSSWQDLVRVLEAKAEVMCWLLEYGRKLGVNYDELPKRDLLYYGGTLKDSGVKHHRYNLHNPMNIASGGFPPGAAPSSVLPQHGRSQRDIPAPEAPPPPTTTRESSNAMFLAQLMQSHG